MINLSTLSDYIKKQREKGVSSNNIRKALITRGYKLDLVDKEIPAFEEKGKPPSSTHINLKIILVIAVLVIVAGSFYVFYSGEQEPTMPESLDEFTNLRSYEYKDRGISYYECSNNKDRIIDMCKNHVLNMNFSSLLGEKEISDQKISDLCGASLGTIYLMYLYKTGQNDKEHFGALLDLFNLGIDGGAIEIGKEAMAAELDSVLNDPAHQSQSNELNLLKGLSSENEIPEFSDDEEAPAYFNNVLIFKNAVTSEECEEIIAEEDGNVMNALLRDACKLAFSKEKRCEAIIMLEVKAGAS